MVVFASMEVQLPKASGFASLCYLHRDVEDSLMRVGSSQGSGVRQKRPTPIPTGHWQSAVSPTTLPVSGVLGHTNIRVGELLDLRVGDILRLDSQPSADLPVLIAGEEKARGRLGRFGRNRAIEITALL
jgi:flagellar motor switch protein FliM